MVGCPDGSRSPDTPVCVGGSIYDGNWERADRTAEASNGDPFSKYTDIKRDYNSKDECN